MTGVEPVGPLLAEGTRVLAEAGVEAPAADARALLGCVLGLTPGRTAARVAAGGGVTAEDARRWRALVARRAQRVPLQHLTGVAGFRHLDLAVGPGVFVPRPETELLVEPVLAHLRALDRPGVVVDLCSGSGAVALAVAGEAPRPPRVVAVEREPDALGWLRRNVAERADAGDPPVEVVAADVADVPAALADLAGDVDVVVANPPYLPDAVLPTLPPEVRDGDPATALVSGPDGLDAVRAVVAAAAVLLRPGGLLAVEHGDDQGAAVPALLVGVGGWDAVADAPDLAGRPRTTTARRAAAPVGPAAEQDRGPLTTTAGRTS